MSRIAVMAQVAFVVIGWGVAMRDEIILGVIDIDHAAGRRLRGDRRPKRFVVLWHRARPHAPALLHDPKPHDVGEKAGRAGHARFVRKPSHARRFRGERRGALDAE